MSALCLVSIATFGSNLGLWEMWQFHALGNVSLYCFYGQSRSPQSQFFCLISVFLCRLPSQIRKYEATQEATLEVGQTKGPTSPNGDSPFYTQFTNCICKCSPLHVCFKILLKLGGQGGDAVETFGPKGLCSTPGLGE